MRDKLFLLSKTEFEKYVQGRPFAPCRPDENISFKPPEMHWRDDYSHTSFRPWWLRTPRYYNTEVCDVGPDGKLRAEDESFADVWDSYAGLRPAMYIDPKMIEELREWNGRNDKKHTKNIIYIGRTWTAMKEGLNDDVGWYILDKKKGLLLSEHILCFSWFDVSSNDYGRSEIRRVLNEKIFGLMFGGIELRMIREAVIDGEESRPTDI